MRNELLIQIDMLEQLDKLLSVVESRAAGVHSFDALARSDAGMMKLDAICMNLITIGEVVKGLDKVSNGMLLPKYSVINWHGVMRMRDKIAHHYFEIDVDVIQRTVEDDIPQLHAVIRQMLGDIRS
ncbi:MAG TPA: antitoxin [Bacteroidales bacterium]|jgi:uncharacterized protein with HEPN domain|nr:antitoxin [Bacteroidales bacterium]